MVFISHVPAQDLYHCIMYLPILMLCQCWAFTSNVVYGFLLSHCISCTWTRCWFHLPLSDCNLFLCRHYHFFCALLVFLPLQPLLHLISRHFFCLSYEHLSMGFLNHSAFLSSVVLFLYTPQSLSSFIKPYSHVLFSHSSSLFFRYCARALLSMLTHSSMLSIPSHTPFIGINSLSTFALGCSAWYKFIIFLSNSPCYWVLIFSAPLFLCFIWSLALSRCLWLSPYFQQRALNWVLLLFFSFILSWSWPSSLDYFSFCYPQVYVSCFDQYPWWYCHQKLHLFTSSYLAFLYND